MTDPLGIEILALPMGRNSVDADTVRDYLAATLARLWSDGVVYTAWRHELYEALAKTKLIDIRTDKGGFVTWVDESHADELVRSAITALGDRDCPHV
jgi:hypothetical protein